MTEFLYLAWISVIEMLARSKDFYIGEARIANAFEPHSRQAMVDKKVRRENFVHGGGLSIRQLCHCGETRCRLQACRCSLRSPRRELHLPSIECYSPFSPT